MGGRKLVRIKELERWERDHKLLIYSLEKVREREREREGERGGGVGTYIHG